MKKLISLLLLVMFTSFSFISDIAKHKPTHSIKVRQLKELQYKEVNFKNDTLLRELNALDKKIKRCESKVNKIITDKKAFTPDVVECDTTDIE